MEKLVGGYVERRVYGRDQKGAMYIIITPDGHVWPREGAEQKHPECFVSEPKFCWRNIVQVVNTHSCYHQHYGRIVRYVPNACGLRECEVDIGNSIFTFRESSLVLAPR